MNKITLYYGTARLYSNRIVRADLSNEKTLTLNEVNFIQADGINTVFNFNIPLENIEEFSNISPSYAIVDDQQCWYVISCNKQRQGQISLQLRRDFLSETWDSLKTAPFICTKSSTIPPSCAYAKYNKTMNLSQVKQNEYLIKDRSNGRGWLVGYVAKEARDGNSFCTTMEPDGDDPSKQVVCPRTYTASDNSENYDITVNSLSDLKYKENEVYYRYTGKIDNRINVQYWYDNGHKNDIQSFLANDDSFFVIDASNYESASFWRIDEKRQGLNPYTDNLWWSQMKEGNKALRDFIINETTGRTTAGQAEDDILNLNEKTVLDKSTNLAYKINIEKQYYNVDFRDTTLEEKQVFFNAIKNYTSQTMADDRRYQKVNLSIITYKISLSPYKGEITFENIADHLTTSGAPYDIFAIPLGGTFTLDNEQIAVNESNMFDLVATIQREATSAIVYDVQWVPYVPIYNTTLTQPNSEYRQFTKITSTNNGNTANVGVFIWLNTSQGTLYINSPLTIELANPSYLEGKYVYPESLAESNNFTLTDNLQQRKFSEENYFRITGPNYSSTFEFDPVKNQSLKGFKVDMALKPYNPYFYISPVYGGLYGGDFKDGRGLILAGDYSLDQVSNAWNNYKLSNKNYELIFNRQIQSLDLKNTYQNKLANQQLVSDIFSATAGTAQGALAGFFMGGGVAGAIVGGATSAAAGITDTVVNAQNRKMERAIRDDQRQAMIDNFEYQMGNIQALPDTLTKVSAFNPDFKIYPLIEYYTCTDEEKTNVDNAIKYNGIDINIICKLEDFDKGYVQGAILQFPTDLNISEEQARAINFELQSGVYYKEI